MGRGDYLDDVAVDGDDNLPDELGRQSFARHLAGVLSQVRQQSDSSVIALVGPWGSGKTSVLKMTEREMSRKKKNDWIVSWFNPWAYSDIESLLVGFFAELRQAMPKDRQWNSARQRVSALGAAVTPLAGAAQFAGINGTDVAKHVMKVIDSGLSATATHNKAERALSKQDRPLLVVLDDLDRLEADELLLVLKLVRMIGRLPNVYYLLSYDEQTLLDVLFDSSIVGRRGDRARDFLEKLVQVKLDLPALRAYQREQMLEAGFEYLAERHNFAIDVEQAKRIRTSLKVHLNRRLDTPRSIRRLVGQIHAMFPAVQGETDFADFFVLTWLRLEEPGVYRMIYEYRDVVLGVRPSVTSYVNDTPAITEKRKQTAMDWHARIVQYGAEERHVEPLEDLLGQLFPAYQAEVKGQRPYGHRDRERATLRRAKNPHYFDRYFAFDVPDEDLRDSIVIRALQELSAGATDTRQVQMVRQALQADADRIIEKLEAFLPEAQHATTPLLTLLGDVRASLPLNTRLFRDPTTELENFALRALLGRDERIALEAVTSVCASMKGLDLLLPGLEILARGEGSWIRASLGIPFPVWATDAVAIGRTQLQRWFYSDGWSAFAEGSEVAIVRWYSWDNLDAVKARGWLSELGARPNMLIKVLEAFVSELRLLGTDTKRTQLNAEDYPVTLLVDCFGEDAIRSSISQHPSIPDMPGRLDNAPENRTGIAVTLLRGHLDNPQAPSSASPKEDLAPL